MGQHELHPSRGDEEEATPLSHEICSVCSQNSIQRKKDQHRSESLPLKLRRSIPFLVILLAACALTFAVTFSLPSQHSGNRWGPANLMIPSGTEPLTGHPQSWFNGSCGTTAETALSLDCQFSSVLHAWLPKDCLTADDVADDDEAYTKNTFPFFDFDTRELLSPEQAHGGTRQKVLTNMEFHLVHCAYVYRRLHRGLTGGPLDSYTADYHHTKHCTDMIEMAMRDPANFRTMTTVGTKFPTCL